MKTATNQYDGIKLSKRALGALSHGRKLARQADAKVDAIKKEINGMIAKADAIIAAAPPEPAAVDGDWTAWIVHYTTPDYERDVRHAVVNDIYATIEATKIELAKEEAIAKELNEVYYRKYV